MNYLKNMVLINEPVSSLAFQSFLNFKNLIHGYSMREGGISDGYYTSLNLGFHNGDDKDNVQINYKIFSNSFGIEPEQIVLSNQSHSTNIKVITQKDLGNGIIKENSFVDIDGMITSEKNIALCTLHADCIPVYFFDPQNEVIGLVHSGWRGTLGKISVKMIQLMLSEFHSETSNIYVGIGPGIEADSYEIDHYLGNQFKLEFPNWKNFLLPKDENHYYLDLKRCIYDSLISIGICSNKIEVSKVCTCSNSEILFSHRASKGKRGNSAALIMMK